MSVILDILYNFFGPHRPKFALWGLIVLGMITTLNAAYCVRELGNAWVVSIFGIGCLSWYLLLPCIIFLIDEKNGRAKLRSRDATNRHIMFTCPLCKEGRYAECPAARQVMNISD